MLLSLRSPVSCSCPSSFLPLINLPCASSLSQFHSTRVHISPRRCSALPPLLSPTLSANTFSLKQSFRLLFFFLNSVGHLHMALHIQTCLLKDLCSQGCSFCGLATPENATPFFLSGRDPWSHAWPGFLICSISTSTADLLGWDFQSISRILPPPVLLPSHLSHSSYFLLLTVVTLLCTLEGQA